MSHVFISYSRKDTETVDKIVGRLNSDGVNVWLDRESIRPGALWRESIVKAVDNAYVCVLMLSPNSAASDNVRKEVDLADGANKEFIPTVLAPVELPAKLRYQLAGVQRIEYYRDPDAKYAELLNVLNATKPAQIASEAQPRREVEIVIKGMDIAKFGPEEQKKLLNTIAEAINVSYTDLKLTTLRAGSVHAFVSMPADAAYRLKAAALNREARLINYGMDALRLTGDRYFVLLKTGRIAPLKPNTSRGCWFIGGLGLMIALLLSVIMMVALPLANPFLPSLFATTTPTASQTFTSTPSYTPTITKTSTSTPSQTPTSTNTLTPTPTNTPSSTPSRTPVPTETFTPLPIVTSPIPNGPTTFSDPVVSTNHFGCAGCPSAVNIRVIAIDPEIVSAVEIHFWLVDQKTGEMTKETSLPMISRFVFLIESWRQDINSMDIPGANWVNATDYWFQFYFLAADKTGAQTQSQTYKNLVTFSTYAVPR
jgi:hypothetical protein